MPHISPHSLHASRALSAFANVHAPLLNDAHAICQCCSLVLCVGLAATQARTPRASKDAETPAAEAVTPRRRTTRAAKTEEPAETEASPRRRGRPPKSPAAK